MARKLDPTLLHAITPPAFDKGKLHRAELVDRIHANLEKSLIVIAAPAGYGKTTLLADFTAHTDLAVCWVRLREGTQDAEALAQLISEAIRKTFRRAARSPAPIFPSDDPAAESLARVLGAWTDDSVEGPFVLIVDDIQSLAENARAHSFLDELIRLRPGTMSLIVSGREVPNLSLARLLAEGQLFGLGPHDLALTRGDVQSIVGTVLGRHVEDLDVERIFTATKGWVTGVVLSSTVARTTIGIAPEGSPLVHEYLSSVVLNHLPDDLRHFALDVSVLPVMSSELCDALLQREDSSRLLRLLMRRGTFVDASEGEPPTYSFHDLFRSFLLATLTATDPARLTRIRSRAASLLERAGSSDAAFRLLIEAQDFERAAKLANRLAPQYSLEGRMDLLRAWWRELPDPASRAPELVLALATTCVDRGDLETGADLAATLEVGGDEPHLPDHRAKLANLRARILFQRGAYQECLERAEEVLSMRAATRRPDIMAVALETKARAMAMMRLRLHEARTAAEASVSLMTRAGNRHSVARALTNLGVVLEAEGDYRAIKATAEKAYGILKDVGTPVELSLALNNLGDILHKEGDLDGSLGAYGEALKYARRGAHPVYEGFILFGQANVFNDAGMALQAAQLYGEGLAIGARLAHKRLVEYGCLQTSVLYRRRGNLPVAGDWMKRVLEQEEKGLRPASVAIQMGALEGSSVPRNGLASIQSALKRKHGVSGEDEVLARVFLSRLHVRLGDHESCLREFGDALALAGSKGCEQAIAAELLNDSEFHSEVSYAFAANPVMEVVTSRIEAMSAFRRVHSTPASGEVQRVFRLETLGRCRMTFAGRELRGMKRQAREVLCYLVDRKAAGKEAISEEFWPEHPPGRRAANTHTAIHAIRGALGKSSVALENGSYALGREIEVGYDVDEFERAAGVAERLASGDPRRFFALTEAISIYTGQFLPDLSSPWILQRRRTLEIRYLDLVADLASEALIRDQPQRALEYLRRGLAIDPLRDDFNLRYLEALDRLGQVSLASQHYLHYAQLVRQELGIDPPEEIRNMYSKLIG